MYEKQKRTADGRSPKTLQNHQNKRAEPCVLLPETRQLLAKEQSIADYDTVPVDQDSLRCGFIPI